MGQHHLLSFHKIGPVYPVIKEAFWRVQTSPTADAMQIFPFHISQLGSFPRKMDYSNLPVVFFFFSFFKFNSPFETRVSPCEDVSK